MEVGVGAPEDKHTTEWQRWQGRILDIERFNIRVEFALN